MGLHLPTRKTPHVSLTPLVDVVFILLIFFLMSINQNKYQKILEADTDTVQQYGDEKVKHYVATVTQSGLVGMDGVIYGDLKKLHPAIVNSGAKKVYLKASKDIDTQRFLNVWHKMSKSTSYKVQWLDPKENAPQSNPTGGQNNGG